MTNMSRNVTIAAVTGVLAMTAVAHGGDPYEALLSNPRVTFAIETNPFIEPGTYMDFLRMKIDQLETGQTESWNDYRHPQPHTDQELAEVILQKVALSLYIEVNELVPWRLLDYDDDNLRVVLGDAFSENSNPPFWANPIVFNLNPLVPFAYAQNLRTLYPDHPIDSAKDLLDLTIIKMRDDGWAHRGSDFSYADACADIGYLGFHDFECFELAKKGASGLTPRVIYSVLHAQNVPSRDLFWFGHGGIEFPSLGFGMDGDGVYSAFEAGVRLRPNFLPVDISYLELSLFEKWSALDRCEGRYLESREDDLQYLALFDDPAWNADVLESFCFRNKFFPIPGDFLRKSLIGGQLGIFCQNEDPDADDYQAPALTDEELDDWFAAIAEFTPECAACTVDAECDDGDWCNGEEICDTFGFCTPVVIAVPMVCDDGLPCTTERCYDGICAGVCSTHSGAFCRFMAVRVAPACDDGLLCTAGSCVDNACTFSPALYGDVNADNVVDLADIICMLDGFAGQYTGCSPESLDIGNCAPDGEIDLADIFAVLDGFQGADPCCGN